MLTGKLIWRYWLTRKKRQKRIRTDDNGILIDLIDLDHVLQFDIDRKILQHWNHWSSSLFSWLDWQNLYEASVNALPSEDEEKTPAPATQPFFLNRPPSVEKALGKWRRFFQFRFFIGCFLEEKAASPPLSPQPKSNPLKPKWEIRLPQLLNGTVGPDRQVRNARVQWSLVISLLILLVGETWS